MVQSPIVGRHRRGLCFRHYNRVFVDLDCSSALFFDLSIYIAYC